MNTTGIALSMYTEEPCRICERMLTIDDVKTGAVFVGYSKDGKSRAAHKLCWDNANEILAHHFRSTIISQVAELAELKEERKRLRDALFKIADHSWYDEMMRGEPIKFITGEDYERKYFEFIDIAKAAVGSNKK